MQYGKIVYKFNYQGREVVLRYPKFEDIKDLLNLINSAVEERAYLLIKKKKTLKEEMNWLLEKIKKIENKQLVFFVIEVDGKIMGSCSIDKGIEKKEHVGGFGILLKKEVRNIGLGQKIIPLLIKEAKKKLKIKMVILQVIKENKIALHVYEKLGFKKVGEIKKGINHFGKYLDEIIMVKYL